MNILTITSKIMNLDMLAQFAIDFGLKKDLKKPSASGNVINTIIHGQNVGALKICSTCKSALDKNNIPHLSVYNGFHYPKNTTAFTKKRFNS